MHLLCKCLQRGVYPFVSLCTGTGNITWLNIKKMNTVWCRHPEENYIITCIPADLSNYSLLIELTFLLNCLIMCLYRNTATVSFRATEVTLSSKPSMPFFFKLSLSLLFFFFLQEKLLWSLEPPGSMVPMGTQCTIWRRTMGCWSTPQTGSGAWDASACTPRMVWLTTRPTPGRGSPRTWWKSSVTCTTRWEGFCSHLHSTEHTQKWGYTRALFTQYNLYFKIIHSFFLQMLNMYLPQSDAQEI